MPKKAMETLTESMFYVLMAFRQGSELCGIDAAELIDRQSGGRLQIGPATLYTVLGKFEKEKYLRETAVEGRKRSYTITEKGRQAYAAELERLRRCVHDAETTQVREEEEHGASE